MSISCLVLKDLYCGIAREVVSLLAKRTFLETGNRSRLLLWIDGARRVVRASVRAALLSLC